MPHQVMGHFVLIRINHIRIRKCVEHIYHFKKRVSFKHIIMIHKADIASGHKF